MDTDPIVDGKATVEPFITEVGDFPPDFDPPAVNVTSWGTETFRFDRPDGGTVSWTTGANSFINGNLDITRLTTQLGRQHN